MDKRYKIILANKRIYKEVELPLDNDHLTIGTTKSCDVRFNRDIFFEDFELTFDSNQEFWSLSCNDNIYISSDGVLKLVTKDLSHGDDFIIKYQKSNQEVLHISYTIDFDFEKKDYNRIIQIADQEKITIGGTNTCDICIHDELICNDMMTLTKKNGYYEITDQNTKYGVYVNGIRIHERAKVCDYDFFSLMGYSFYQKQGILYTQTENKMEIFSLDYEDTRESKSELVYPKFNRNTRLKYVIPTDAISILDPPVLPTKPKRNLLISLIPAVVMLVLTIVIRGFMSNGGSFIIFSICSMGMGIITSIYSYLDSGKQYKTSMKERNEKYRIYINRKKEQIETVREEEKQILEETYYSIHRELNLIDDFSGDLFNRSIHDPDFLDVRLGTGALRSNRQVEYKLLENFETEDELNEIPEQISEVYEYLAEAPVVVKLLECNAVGVVGREDRLYDIMKNMLLDICIRQYQTDVKLFFIMNEEDTKKLQWIKYLPHLQNEELGMRNIVCDEESKNILFEYLYKELSRREAEEISYPQYVVFGYSEVGMKRHPITQYLEKANELGFTFLFFEESKELLPQGCQKIILLHPEEQIGEIIHSEDATRVSKFQYSVMEDNVAANVVERLAPVYCEEVSLDESLTKNISLYELLGIMNVDDIDLQSRWNTSEIYKSMAAPIGVKSKSEIICLDLNEKHHGPHGLVAGTTGSGKSEILQTYILSMASLFHPYEVGFVIIDFKGGGMVNQFKNLPHLIGSITNIDGREINRSLLSIKAELKKRQEIFAKYNVNHIDSYIKLFKCGETQIPLPHLILIVDEFAELKMDQPEFMKELISAARIGRSLGVHLILATQKPSGVVDAQIWSNSKFRLCLKVQNKEDSNEVLKTPLAAEIKEPGRAYLQVGNNEIFDLFQSAYSGAPANHDASTMKKEYSINAVSLTGKKIPIFVSKKEKTNQAVKTQLEAMVEYINEFCKENGIVHLPGICMPPLEEMIAYPSKHENGDNLKISLPIGIYDDPDNQLQGEISIEISSGNLLILGSSLYGKTNLLQVLIRGIAEQYTPNEVAMYILDFASMALNVFDGLHHVGGVVVASEDDKLKNFFRMILAQIKERKEIFSKIGITSYSSYKEAGNTDLPTILILVDNFQALKELYPEYEDNLLNICREGISVGIYMIVTAKQSNGISYKYLSNFSNRICLYCTQKEEYGNMFDRCRMEPKNVPGRGLISMNKAVYEYQSYLAFEGEKEIDRVQAIKLFMEVIAYRYKDQYAKQIPEVPKCLDVNYLEKHFRNHKVLPYQVPVGIDYDLVDFCLINLRRIQMLCITGKEGSGKTNFVKHIIYQLYRNMFDCPVKVFVLDDYRKQLQAVSSYGIVETYTTEANKIENILQDLEEELMKRYETLQTFGMDDVEKEPLLLCVIQNNEILSANGLSKESMERFKNIMKVYRQLKVCFLFANIENIQIAYSAPEILKMIKECKDTFLFDDLADLKLQDVSTSILRQYKKAIELGDAYYITEKGIQKLKTVHIKEDEV